MKQGKVWLVGAGPGDAGLMTLKGKTVLEQADIVLYDQLIGEAVLRMVPARAEKIDVGKQAGNHKAAQQDINRILAEEAQAGRRVVRLKGGDPFVFGRGGEELEFLCEQGIPFEVVPGVSSALAVPAYAGIPVTHRNYASSVHVVAAHRRPGENNPIDYGGLAALTGTTLVFLMGVAELWNICDGLIQAGMSPATPAAILENGTTAQQRQVVSTLEHLPEQAVAAGIGTPGIIVVGGVCTLAERFSWAEKRPLAGRRILITRPDKQGSALAEPLYALGAEVIELPCTETVPLDPCPDLERLGGGLSGYNWLAFTSAAGVHAFFDWMRRNQRDIRTLAGIRFAAVGEKTGQALELHGVLPEFVPDTYHATALAHGIAARLRPGETILAVGPEPGETGLQQELRLVGVPCSTAAVYRTETLKQTGFSPMPEDIAAFASASAVRGFVQAVDVIPAGLTAVCIGEKTAEAASGSGMQVIQSPQATTGSMIETIVTQFGRSVDE